MAGAGVSAGNPSAPPGWKATNAAKLFDRVCEAVITRCDRHGYSHKKGIVVTGKEPALVVVEFA
jgi:hypothetical protein